MKHDSEAPLNSGINNDSWTESENDIPGWIMQLCCPFKLLIVKGLIIFDKKHKTNLMCCVFCQHGRFDAIQYLSHSDASQLSW